MKGIEMSEPFVLTEIKLFFNTKDDRELMKKFNKYVEKNIEYIKTLNNINKNIADCTNECKIIEEE
jgi:hypothetical protein